MKKPWHIYISMLINLGSSEEIAIEDKETFYAEPNKTFGILTTFEYEITQFNDKNIAVRNTFERQKDFESYPIKGYCEFYRMGNTSELYFRATDSRGHAQIADLKIADLKITYTPALV